ncbi:transglutaminase-like domain-containing protein [Paenibacillus sp. WLX2291]|uniref:transglutaminase-like domain-containing protein n=1 Tax=Paenibacillus sp. WLX2291 TaxID=3296934 RepID=UPI0039844930
MTVQQEYGLNRQDIADKLAWKRQQISGREQELFGVLEQPLEPEERLLLEWLYAYMPLHDLADYDGEYFLKHVRHVLQVRQNMPWGTDIPDELFVRFVLPYRVNNENIDNSRIVIYDELAPRVQQLSLHDAILETNYWCHERATYIGTDIRTVSPLTIMRTALGRCGEQSTFTVTALRSVGIPARQCYTPRWAHCDSNHAWVEAWADGQWHYLGACEPEPVLDEGWFRLPAKRAMLVNTRIAGPADGPEEVCSTHPWYNEINMLDRYAATRTLTVRTVDNHGQPLAAEVQYQQYNAAEFFPLSILNSGDNGVVSLTTGYGDLLLHARTVDGQLWGEQLVSAQEMDVTLVLTTDAQLEASPLKQSTGTLQWKMSPSPAPTAEEGPEVTDAQRERHEQRVQEGTAIRTAFEQTFVTAEQAKAAAEKWQLPVADIQSILQSAKGNGAEIMAFLEQCASAQRELALRLLQSLRPKDLHDTFTVSLHDHLLGAAEYEGQWSSDRDTFNQYVLCPRVHFEMIAPYRSYFGSLWNEQQKTDYRQHPQQLADALQQQIVVLEQIDRYPGMATPAGAHRLGVTDSLSRDIVFVAAARSLGIAARLEPLNQLPQYWQQNQWHDLQTGAAERYTQSGKGVAEDAANDLFTAVPSADENPTVVPSHNNILLAADGGKGHVIFRQSTEGDSAQEPVYYQNFTLALLEQGLYRTLHLPYGGKQVCDHPYEVLPGQYRLTTGTRLSDGSVLGRFAYFTVKAGETVETPLVFRPAHEEVPILSEQLPGKVRQWIAPQPEAVLPSSIILAWLEPEREPTKHLLREWSEWQQEWNHRPEALHLLVQHEREREMLITQPLPRQSSIAIDERLEALAQLPEVLEQVRGQQRPVVLVVDEQQRIRFSVQGYKPGTASDVVKILDQLMPANAASDH